MQTRPFRSSTPTGIEMNGGCAATPMWIDCPLALPCRVGQPGQITGLCGLSAWDNMGYHGIKGRVKQNPRNPGGSAGLGLERSSLVLASEKNKSKTSELWAATANKTLTIKFM